MNELKAHDRKLLVAEMATEIAGGIFSANPILKRGDRLENNQIARDVAKASVVAAETILAEVGL